MERGEQITIKNRTYTVTSIYTFDDGKSQRVTLETKSGATKSAMFYEGQFDVWEAGSSKPAAAKGKNRRTINWNK